MTENRKERNFGTLSVWAGEDGFSYEGATQIPVFHSVTYSYDDVDQWFDVALGNKPGHIYSRNTNPTVRAFELKLKELESAKEAISFSTGMAAISNTLFSFLFPGDRIVSIQDTYGGTNKIFIEFLPKINVEVALCDTLDHQEIEKEISKGCKILYLETPTNPTLKILDIKRLTDFAHQHGAIVILDNTFATPVNQHPVDFGVDLIIHSATKFLGGHSEINENRY